MDDFEIKSSHGYYLSFTWEDIDVENFYENARPFLKNTILDPYKIPTQYLGEVCKCIVNRAWQDTGYCLTAAKLCTYIAHKEKEAERGLTLPKRAFQLSILEHVTEFSSQWSDTAKRSNPIGWFSYCRFIAFLYVLLAEFKMPLCGLENIVISTIKQLAIQLRDVNVEQLSLMCWMLETCGSTLKDSVHGNDSHLPAIVNTLRDLFLESGAGKDPRLRSKLLMCIEMSANGWSLPSDVQLSYKTLTETSAAIS